MVTMTTTNKPVLPLGLIMKALFDMRMQLIAAQPYISTLEGRVTPHQAIEVIDNKTNEAHLYTKDELTEMRNMLIERYSKDPVLARHFRMIALGNLLGAIVMFKGGDEIFEAMEQKHEQQA